MLLTMYIKKHILFRNNFYSEGEDCVHAYRFKIRDF